ncbi:MAG: hypothetical protein NT169_07400 [Chloroflexi bacterium]|nr:hypothetical protein [Chloroflexota bacterium]
MNALVELVALADRGDIPCGPAQATVNMHCHTFFSFNAYGYSPTALVWLAKRRGLAAIGTVDFDVLDAVDEFLAACDLAGVRGSAGIETRVFIPQFATREINSPGEPGIYYHMGIGFTSSRVPDATAAILTGLRDRAERRNRTMLARLNAHLAPVTVDYERDVLPLTPAGNTTERHMLLAIIRAAERHTAEASLPAARTTHHAPPTTPIFWAAKLGLPADQVAASIGDYVKFSNLVRGKLMKRGGVGYVTPSPDSFPTVEEFHSFIVACGALPCVTWLDGLSAGEQAIHELLELLIGQGAVALNIIPDRNWNIPDPDQRRIKVAKLHEIVGIAAEYDLPLNIGTEMNAPGNKLVDDFAAPELAPVRQAFLDGAYFIYGHTVMQRALGRGYQSAWAKQRLPTRRERNAFYTAIGQRVPPGASGLAKLRALDTAMLPGHILASL